MLYRCAADQGFEVPSTVGKVMGPIGKFSGNRCLRVGRFATEEYKAFDIDQVGGIQDDISLLER